LTEAIAAANLASSALVLIETAGWIAAHSFLCSESRTQLVRAGHIPRSRGLVRQVPSGLAHADLQQRNPIMQCIARLMWPEPPNDGRGPHLIQLAGSALSHTTRSVSLPRFRAGWRGPERLASPRNLPRS